MKDNITIDFSDKQADAIDLLTDRITREVLYGGAKMGGKSFLGCAYLIGMATGHPETSYFIAREELNDLRKHTLPSIHEVFKVVGLKAEDYFVFNGQDNILNFHNGSKIYLLACKKLPSDPLYERFGSMQFTQGWIEEAGEIEEQAYENLRLSIGRWNNVQYNIPYKLLITCNPKKGWLKRNFYDLAVTGQMPEDKAFVSALVTDNVFRSETAEQTLNEIKNSTARQRLRYGEWDYDDDDNCLIEYARIEDMYTNEHVQDGQKYITADIAFQGSDNFVLFVWSGLKIIDAVIMGKSDPTQIELIIKRLSIEYRVPRSNIAYDADGVGSYLRGYLRNAYAFVNNSKTVSELGNTMNFQNLKTQCYFKLAEKINNGEIFITEKVAKTKINDIFVRDILAEELQAIKEHNVDKDGKLQIIPKEKMKSIIGHSPDVADAMMMRMYFELKPRAKSKPKISFGRI